MSGVDLRGMDLRDARIEGICLRDANLEAADLQRAVLCRVDLRGANLKAANLSEVMYDEGVSRTPVNMEGANLEGAILSGRHGWGSLKDTVSLRRANLRGAHLTEVEELRQGGLPRLGEPPAARALEGAQLSLDGTFLLGLALMGTDLSKVRLPDTVEAGAVRDCLEPLVASLHARRGNDAVMGDLLDLAFNQRNNGASVLTSIDSIDDAYMDLKVALMQGVSEALATLSDAQLARVRGRVRGAVAQSALCAVAVAGPAGGPGRRGGGVGVGHRSAAREPTVGAGGGPADVGETGFGRGGEFAAAHGMGIYQLLYVLEHPSESVGEASPKGPLREALRQMQRDLAGDLRAAYVKRLPEPMREQLAQAQDRDDENYFAVLSTDRQSALFFHHDYFKSFVLGEKLVPTHPQGPVSYEGFQAVHFDSTTGSIKPADAEALKAFPILSAAYTRDATNRPLSELVARAATGRAARGVVQGRHWGSSQQDQAGRFTSQ